MKKKSAAAPKFPMNYGWFTNNSHVFTPRSEELRIEALLAESFLSNDRNFQHILRQCKNVWYVAVTLGKNTVSVAIYDSEYVHDTSRPVLSTPTITARGIIFAVNRDGIIGKVTDEVRAMTITAGAMLYATRSLHPSEVTHFDKLGESLSKTIEAHDRSEVAIAG